MVDYYDQKAGTMQKDQSDLSLKSVQRMFAGRQEHHQQLVEKLVKINRISQMSKADPLIKSDYYPTPSEDAMGDSSQQDFNLDSR